MRSGPRNPIGTMRRQFTAQSLAEILRDVYVAERSGVLTLRGEPSATRDEAKKIDFTRGMIFLAEATTEEQSLGPFLVREGCISSGALLEAQRSLDGRREAPALARALVQRDLIAREALAHAVRRLIERVVGSAFRWPLGTAEFEEAPQQPDLLEPDVLTTVEVILDGIMQMEGFGAIHEAMRALDNRLCFRQPPLVPLERLTLSPAHGFILSRVDGRTNVNEVISILPPGEDEPAARFIFGMLVLGVIGYDPNPGQGLFRVSDILRDHADREALERMQEQMIRQATLEARDRNPQELLGLPPSASPAQIERAYEEAKAQFGRDRLIPRVRERFRNEITLIESRLVEAYLTLTQPDTGRSAEADQPPVRGEIEVDDMRVRVEMDKAKSKVALEAANKVADAYYAKARRAMREGDFHNAIQYGKLAISYNQSDARYYYMLADCQARNPDARWQRLAEENYTKATQLDPWNAEYWISLGRFYKGRGLNIRARKQFEEALKLTPSNEGLAKELESVS